MLMTFPTANNMDEAKAQFIYGEFRRSDRRPEGEPRRSLQ